MRTFKEILQESQLKEGYPMSQKQRIFAAMKRHGEEDDEDYLSISIDDGDLIYAIAKVNEEMFDDLAPNFVEQLEDEGKIDYYVSFMSRKKKPPFSAEMLPIYGNPNRWVTKWLCRWPEECLERDLRDRNMCLAKRIMNYENKKKK